VRDRNWPEAGDPGPEMKDGVEQQPSSSAIAEVEQGDRRDLPDDTSARNSALIIPLSRRPRIERAVDCDGFYVLRGDHAWLLGDRSSALAEFGDLERIERWGRT